MIQAAGGLPSTAAGGLLGQVVAPAAECLIDSVASLDDTAEVPAAQ